MNSSVWIQRLFSCPGRSKSRRDLSTMHAIDAWQGKLHRQFASIHVAGTNGKGSVAVKMAAALQATGLKVGLYTSPHISSYRERIQVNGECIEDDFTSMFLPKLFVFIDEKGLAPTFFDLLTVLAFEYFAAKKVDVAVLEVGLGGEFDATNIVQPRLSVITSIDYDHCDVLGATLDLIAQAKAGIIKEGVPVVLGPRAQLPPILNAAKNQAIFAPKSDPYYDYENNAIARTALEVLNVPESAIAFGLQRRPPCRFELVDSRPIILDVAHNSDGFAHLKQACEFNFPGMRFHLILAMGKEKDAAKCIEQLGDLPVRVACVSNEHPRLASASELLSQLQSKGFTHTYAAPTLEAAFDVFEPIIVCGSFFIMNDARHFLRCQLV